MKSVAWCPSGTKVATGSFDGCLRIVDAATGTIEKGVPHERDVPYGTASPMLSVAWSP